MTFFSSTCQQSWLTRHARALFLTSVIFVASALAARPALARTTQLSGDQYVQECADAGVPIPPPLNFSQVTDPNYNPDPNQPHWVYQGILDKKFTNGLTTPPDPAHVFYYRPSDNSGLCMALPRLATPTSNLTLFGVICQGTATSKACFWDTSNIPQSTTVCMKTSECNSRWSGGAGLINSSQACTDCHSGDNVFIIHPDSKLDLDNVMSANWYEPITPEGWPQNEGPMNYFIDTSNSDSCIGCHADRIGGRFPEINSGMPLYCERVIGSWATTMPPADTDLTKFEPTGLPELFDACSIAPELAPGVPRIGLAGYQHATSRPPSILEMLEISNRVASGDDFNEIRDELVSPYFRKLPNGEPWVELDGVLENNWALYSKPQWVDRVTEGAASAEDISAQWRAMWDDDHLYVFVEVMDDVIKTDGPNVWDDDAVELFIDGQNDSGTTYNNNDYHFFFRPFEDPIYWVSGNNSGTSDAVYHKTLPTLAGYNLEVAIPWSTIGMSPGGQIGFEIHVLDDDDGSSRDAQRTWRTSEGDAWANPARFTTIDLPEFVVSEFFPETITIDGFDNETNWTRAGMTIERQAAPIALSDNSGYWRSFWDDENLYFFVNVSDNDVRNPDSSKAYDDDSVELYIDGNNSHNNSFDGYDDYQLIFRYGENNLLHFGDQSLVESNFVFQSAIRSTSVGYDLEVKIPWSSLKASPAEYATMGFDIQINDDDNGSGRDGKLSWCSLSNDSYHSPANFCSIKFAGFGESGFPIERAPQNSQARSPDIDNVLVLDGNVWDALWAETPALPIDHIIDAPTGNATLQTRWNEEYLYLLVTMAENADPYFGNSSAWYGDDSVEVYIDANNSRDASYDDFDYQLFFHPYYPNAVQFGANSKRIPDGDENDPGDLYWTKNVWSQTRLLANTGGWVMEIAIPWENLGIVYKDQPLFGLEVQVNDNDGAGRIGKLAWHGTALMGDVAWHRSDAFKTVRLDQ